MPLWCFSYMPLDKSILFPEDICVYSIFFNFASLTEIMAMLNGPNYLSNMLPKVDLFENVFVIFIVGLALEFFILVIKVSPS